MSTERLLEQPLRASTAHGVSLDDGTAPKHSAACPCRDCTSYTAREVHFVVAHWPEYVSLNEGSGESGRNLREYLRREWEHLPAGVICVCGKNRDVAEAAEGHGGAGTSARTPSVPLAEIRRAYEALPATWRAKTRLYLVTHELHDLVGRWPHTGTVPCQDQDHVLYHSETDVYTLEGSNPGAFLARHRRRMALETFGQAPRPQDRLVEPANVDVYARLANWINQQSDAAPPAELRRAA